MKATNETNEAKFKVLGVNDDESSCMCCGKQNLARVVWIKNLETGKIQHFGTVCAANPAKAFGVASEIRSAINSFKAKTQQAITLAHRAYRAAGGKYVSDGKPLHEGGSWLVADPSAWQSFFQQAKEAA